MAGVASQTTEPGEQAAPTSGAAVAQPAVAKGITETSESSAPEGVDDETQAAATSASAEVDVPPGEKNDHKFFFFHKTEVAEDQFVADYEFCGSYAGRVEPPRGPNIYTPNAIAAGVTGFLGGLERGNQRRRMFRAVMRKCMSMKGYARYAIEEEALEELWDGGWAEAKGRVAARAAQQITSERRVVP